MSRTLAVRTYGRKAPSRTKQLFTELPVSPTDKKRRPADRVDSHEDNRADSQPASPLDSEAVLDLTEKLTLVSLDDPPKAAESPPEPAQETYRDTDSETKEHDDGPLETSVLSICDDSIESGLRILSWADMCPPGDRIEKIAEASYAEVYRVTNERGTSIIKAIRLASPIRVQTKAQVRSGLVDEEPHDEADLRGELAISELLADIPGFVIYKERYIVRGRSTRELLETHQAFQRRAKRQDPDRLQFYPSPSRYLDATQFLVIELGDAGRALEDIAIETLWQLWDVFLHVAIALARAEDLVRFEHRDLHEGNLCVRQVTPPREKTAADDRHVMFGYSGLDITILDYGLSRADERNGEPIAFDLEKDLGLFTSTHAPQCRVYRQMRSYLLKGDREHLAPACHQRPYDAGPDGQPISWRDFAPYTNVLWLAYLYDYLVRSFRGPRRDATAFRRQTHELWRHMNPDAPPAILSFGSATDIVRFCVEAGWLTEGQLVGSDTTLGVNDDVNLDTVDGIDETDADAGRPSPDESIIETRIAERDEAARRRSPRRRQPVVRYS